MPVAPRAETRASRRRAIFAPLVGIALAACCSPAQAQDDRYRLHGADVSVIAGQTVEVPVYLDIVNGTLGAPLPIDGWEYTACRGSSNLSLLNITEGSATLTINNGLPAHYRAVQCFGFRCTVTTLVDFTAVNHLPAGTNHELDRITVVYPSTQTGIQEISFCAPQAEAWSGAQIFTPIDDRIEIEGLAPLDPRFQASMVQVHAGVGTSVDVPLILDAPPDANGPLPDIRGWTFGVCHDSTQLTLIDIALGADSATINNGNPPAFNALNPAPSLGPGFAVSIIIDLFGMYTLPAAAGLELHVATYQVHAAQGIAAPLTFCQNMTPPNPPLVIYVGGFGEPLTPPGSITATATYIRGDCGGDGAVNLSDALFLLNYLFPQGTQTTPNCPRACDANSDASLNLLDAVYLLESLFATAPPALDAPTSCGTDGQPQNPLDCAAFAGCM